MGEPYAGWLASLDEQSLAALLARRPEAAQGTPPRDLTELAARLHHPNALVAALGSLPLPCLQMTEALQALGAGCTIDTATALLDAGESSQSEHQVQVTDTLRRLIDHGVVWPGAGRAIRLPSSLGRLYPRPLGLGPRLDELLEPLALPTLRTMQDELGLPAGKSKAAVLGSIVLWLSQPDRVRTLAALAPHDIRQQLEAQARRGAEPGVHIYYDSTSYQRSRAMAQWAQARGLVVGDAWGQTWQMPAEVGLALRGTGYRAPFTPQAPVVQTTAIDPQRVESESTVAATTFADHSLSILDHLSRRPVPTLKSGGVGVRELTKLAKATGASEVEVRLVLELADEAGLIAEGAGTAGVSPAFATWRAQDPGGRFAVLLHSWWHLGATPTESRDDEGKAIPALSGGGHCDGCRRGRETLLLEATRMASARAAERVSLGHAAVWARPLIHLVEQDGKDIFATVWREAEHLGVLALGTASRLGRLLVDDDLGSLVAHAAALLPQTSNHATFGTDLTAMVVGAPSAALSSLLDSTADREGRGGATVWRISPVSIRRALDAGATGPGLVAGLAAIAAGDLPQPLRYLIADVARRHGLLRVSPAVSTIHSEDTALLAEVAVDRKLKKLGLRLIAPTVLACEVPADAALEAMRAAGYFPMPAGDAADGMHAPAAPAGVDWTPVDLAGRALDSGREGLGWGGSGDEGRPGEGRAHEGRADEGRAGEARGDQGTDELVQGLLADLPEDFDVEEFLLSAVEAGLLDAGPDPAALAADLVGKVTVTDKSSAPANGQASKGADASLLAKLNPRLSGTEVRLLIQAMEGGTPVVVHYTSDRGTRETLELDEVQLQGSCLLVWSEPHQIMEVISVATIQGVDAAS